MRMLRTLAASAPAYTHPTAPLLIDYSGGAYDGQTSYDTLADLGGWTFDQYLITSGAMVSNAPYAYPDFLDCNAWSGTDNPIDEEFREWATQEVYAKMLSNPSTSALDGSHNATMSLGLRYTRGNPIDEAIFGGLEYDYATSTWYLSIRTEPLEGHTVSTVIGSRYPLVSPPSGAYYLWLKADGTSFHLRYATTSPDGTAANANYPYVAQCAGTFVAAEGVFNSSITGVGSYGTPTAARILSQFGGGIVLSTFEPELPSGGTSQLLAALVHGVSSTVAGLRVSKRLATLVHGTSTQTPGLRVGKRLAALVHGTSMTTAALRDSKPMAAAVHGTSTPHADLRDGKLLAGAIHGASHATGTLNGGPKLLAATVHGTSSPVGALRDAKQLAASVHGTSSTTPGLRVSKLLAAAVHGTCSYFANLSAGIVTAFEMNRRSTGSGS